MSVERNAPCPCGSGRKYKKCCLAEEASARSAHDLAMAPLRAVFEALGKDVQRTFPAEAVAAAARAFCGFDESLAAAAEEEVFLAAAYLFFEHVPAPGSVPGWVDGETLGDRYLRTHGDRLSTAERAMLVSFSASAWSFYGVVDLQPSEGARVRDLLLGNEVDVIDPYLARDVALGDVLFLRLVPDGTRFRIGACGSVTLPPSLARAVGAFRTDYITQGPDGYWSELQLRANANHVRFCYLELVTEARHPDDDDVDDALDEVVELEFEVASAARAHEALCHLAGDLGPEDLEIDIERDAGGAVIAASWPWYQEHVEPDGAVEHVIFGAFYVDGTRLLVEVPDAAHADLARALVASALPDAREVVANPDAAPFLDGALIAAHALEVSQAFWDEWPTRPAAALEGLTPLQALEHPNGRERVAAYLDGIEEAWPMMGLPPTDTTALRQRLGLAART